MTKAILAEQKWSPIQRALFIGTLLGCIALGIVDFELFVWLFSLFLLVLYSVIVLCKVLAALFGLINRFTIYIKEDEYQALSDDELPIYTILLPLYKESEVVEKLVAHIGCLDYPKEKLDVKVLLEQDDEETLQAVQQFGLPDWCDLIIVPDEGPKTKPRACNVGLAQARGEFCVIYDAEDQPEPDQLKKVICAYKRLPESVVCLQAKLNFFNAKEGLLPRCFALEYTTWFDLYLPGLHALHAPIPLGGTSNHFKTQALQELDGWDPYNVTEDCDLGIRIAEAGYATRIVDSVTWEEAPFKVKDWVGQRSRWIKGYFQTFWVHTRRPWYGLRRLGLWGFFQMLITVGGQVATVFLNPICWLILAAWCYWQWPIIYVHSPYTLVLFAISLALFQFNILFIGIHLIGALRRRCYFLIPYILFLPFYWILVSIGAWRGVLEFFWSPYKWVKTSHGLTQMANTTLDIKQLETEEQNNAASVYIKPVMQGGIIHNLCMGTSILVITALITSSSLIAPVYFGYTDKVEQASIALKDNFIEVEQKIPFAESSWMDYDTLNIALNIKRESSKLEEALSVKDLRLMFYLKVRNGEWFHQTIDAFEIQDNTINVQLSLNEHWNSLLNDFEWSRDLLHRVRSFGVKLFYKESDSITATITALTPVASTASSSENTDLTITSLEAPNAASCYGLFEARWLLSKTYSNPFDSDVIQCDATFTHEHGSSITIPAFYTQDYYQYKSKDGEVLQPRGRPHWAVRHAPSEAGRYTWHIHGKDKFGNTFQSTQQTLDVEHREHRGFLTLGKNKRFFAFENGEFFYPMSLNIRSPRDEVNHEYWSFEMPKKADGTYVMFEFLSKMKKTGINVGRVWMSPWFGSIEWNKDEDGYHGLGVYNLKNAYRLDSIFNFAQKQGILIELALNHHGPFTQQYDSQWVYNPYNKKNGGPAATPRHVFPNQESRSWFKKRLRYIAARYGAYANLYCYVLWIEANVVDPRPHVLVDWHKEFGPYMKAIDANRHLVSTEFNNNGYRDIWRQKEIEYTQVAAYNFGKGNIHEIMSIAKTLRPYDKPAIVEEYMGLPSGGHEDVLAHDFHDGFWANWMLPFGGAPMPWWWNFIFEKGIDVQYQVINAYIKGEDLSDRQWKHLFEMQLPNGAGLRALGRLSKDQAFFWVYKDTASNVRFTGAWRKRRQLAHQAYRQHVPHSFSPIDQITGKKDSGFMDMKNVKLTIPGGTLDTGTYMLEFWDTWQLKEPITQEIVIESFPYNLELPRLTKDIAIKLKKLN